MQAIKDKLKGMGLQDSTIKTYCSILIHFFEHTKKTTNFTEQEISNYLDYLIIKKNYSGRSRNLVMKVIRFYCREFLELVSKWVGHSVRQTTQIYTQCRKIDYSEAVEKCEVINIIV